MNYDIKQNTAQEITQEIPQEVSGSETLKMELVLALRRAGVTDPDVVATMERVPREVFVPDAFKDRSYEDITLPIGHHQTLSQPAVVGLMTEALELDDRKKVLEVGTGSGYQTAILSPLCRRVYTIERQRELLLAFPHVGCCGRRRIVLPIHRRQGLRQREGEEGNEG